MAISLNGMVATGQGETPWGEASWDNFISAVERYGNLIIGRTTYEVMHKEGSFSLLREKPQIVIVSQDANQSDDAIWVTSPAEALAALHGQETVLIGGGPGLATSMIEQNQVDEVHLDVEPMLLGNGLPLLSKQLTRQLKLLEVTQYSEGVTVKYTIERDVL